MKLSIGILLLVIALIAALTTVKTFQPRAELPTKLPEVAYAQTGSPIPESTPEPQLEVLAEGKVSYYSHAGCLGCGENQITASGEKFDENAMTLAIPREWRKKIPMGTRVLVTNTATGVSVEAKVNDTGGFLKYGRVADLSKGLYQKLGAKTDKTIIKIEKLEVK